MLSVIKTCLLFTASMFIYFTSSSQTVYKLWDNVIQANSYDGRYLQMERINDNRLILLCLTGSDSGYDKTMNLFQGGLEPWVMMIDGNGNKLWDRDFYGGQYTYGITVLNSNDYALLALINADAIGGDITAAVTPGTNHTGGNWIVDFDSAGTIRWNKRFGEGVDTVQPTVGHATIGATLINVDGKIYVTATSAVVPTLVGGDLTAINCPNYPMPINPFSWRYTDMLLYKVNPNDTLTNEWQQLYGGDSTEIATSILAIANGFLVGGITTSQTSCNQTVSAHQNPYYDLFVSKTDMSGNIIWQQRYGGSNNDFLRGFIDAGNNEYLLYGHTLSDSSYEVGSNGYNDTSLWIVKIDGAGNKIWDKRFGSCEGFRLWGYDGNGPVREEQRCKAIDGIHTTDGGFLFVSNVKDSFPCGDVSEASRGNNDYWMLKLDSAGNKQWDKRFGGPGYDIAERVLEMSPGYYIIGGFSEGNTIAEKAIGGDKSEITIGLSDIWLVGVVDSAVVTGLIKNNIDNKTLTIIPNPSKDNCTITAKEFINSTLTIYDMTGRKLLQESFNGKTTIDVTKLTNGVYIIEVRDKEVRSVKGKLVKE